MSSSPRPVLEALAHVGITWLSGLIQPERRPDYFGAARTAALEVIKARSSK